MAGTVVIGRVHAHAGARDAIFAEGDSRGNGFLLKCPVLFVEIKLVGLSVVGNEDIGPAVAVVVQNGDSQTLGSWIVESGFCVASSNLPLPRLCQSRTEVPL